MLLLKPKRTTARPPQISIATKGTHPAEGRLLFQPVLLFRQTARLLHRPVLQQMLRRRRRQILRLRLQRAGPLRLKRGEPALLQPMAIKRLPISKDILTSSMPSKFLETGSVMTTGFARAERAACILLSMTGEMRQAAPFDLAKS